MNTDNYFRRLLWMALISVLLSASADLNAAGHGQGGGGSPPPARQAAPIDLTGYWAAVVTEDWRHRMVTPPKGDYLSVPLNEEGTRVADAWDLEADVATGNECRAFGAAGIMRLPGRVHITWESDDVLRIDTDTGDQTRLFYFDPPERPNETERTWQGDSIANWEGAGQLRGRGRGAGRGVPRNDISTAGDSLKVVTTRLRAGYLRKNGVPYSEDALLTEYYNRFPGPDGEEWFVVTTVVEDPMYLTEPYVTSSHFIKEADDSGWRLFPCRTDPPQGLPFGTGIID